MTGPVDISFRFSKKRAVVFLGCVVFFLWENNFSLRAQTNFTNDAGVAVLSVSNADPWATANGIQTNVAATVTDTNITLGISPDDAAATNVVSMTLAMANYYVKTQQPEKALSLLIGLMKGDIPDAVHKAAMLTMAEAVRSENDLPRAQSIYSQYLEHWPGDAKVPEILLRQGEIFRQMGLNDLALSKFYSVMTAALSLKNDQLDYYQSLVLQTQLQIADTHYLMGHFSDAADFYARLLKNTDPNLDHAQVQFRLVRSLAIINRNDQAIAEGEDFITRFPAADQVPEVRYYLAEALKALGRNTESLQQVLLCLREQKSKTQNNPEVWTYWQQRVGNEIGNQLYHEGDYVKSLEVYVVLAQLDSSAAWQVPVQYQMGMVYEKLMQPQKAIETYNLILSRASEIGTNSTPALKTVFDMARWRANFVQWQTNAEAMNHAVALTPATNSIN